MCSNCHRRHWDFRLVPLGTTLHVHHICTSIMVCRGTRYVYMNIYMNAYVPFVTYAWRTWEHILFVVVVVVFTSLHTLCE